MSCPSNSIVYNGQVTDSHFALAANGMTHLAIQGGFIQVSENGDPNPPYTWFNGNIINPNGSDYYATQSLGINQNNICSTSASYTQCQSDNYSGWIWFTFNSAQNTTQTIPTDGSAPYYSDSLILGLVDAWWGGNPPGSGNVFNASDYDGTKIKLNVGDYVSFKGKLTQSIGPGTTLTFNIPIYNQMVWWDNSNPTYTLANQAYGYPDKLPVWGYQIKIGNTLSQLIVPASNPANNYGGGTFTNVQSSSLNPNGGIDITITIPVGEQFTDVFEFRAVSQINTIDPQTNQGKTNYYYLGSTELAGGGNNGLTVTGCIPNELPPPPPPPTPTTECSPVIFNLNDGKNFEVPSCENDLELTMWLYFGQPTTDCYSVTSPILGRITTTDPLVNQYLTQISEFNSSAGFDSWVQLKATLPTSGLTFNFGVNLEFYAGLDCCCTYDIFVDDIRIGCSKQESAVLVNDIQCPGFIIDKVIDNKKSWVYNPGVPSVGISEYDRIEREDGSFGMLNGEGTINRTFAPSLDASIPWRYTDYIQQSSVREKHSNLVLNTKELDLTFDMCADCLKYSAFTYTTEITNCYTNQYVDIPLTAYTSNGTFVFTSLVYGTGSASGIFFAELLPAGSYTNTGITFDNYVTYFVNKVNSGNYMSQNIPGQPYTAYTVSFNSNQNALIRVESLFTGCTDLNSVSLKIEYSPTGGVIDPENPTQNTVGYGIISQFTGGTLTITSGITTGITYTYASLYELETYKKQFQSFWIPFMEQFIPATTIWVAGERWCNEPCPIINPCDYDFELVDAELSFESVPEGFYPTTCSCPNGYVAGGSPGYEGSDPAKCININDNNDVITCGSTPTTVPTPQTSSSDLGGSSSGQNVDPNTSPNYTLVQDYGQTKQTPNV